MDAGRWRALRGGGPYTRQERPLQCSARALPVGSAGDAPEILAERHQLLQHRLELAARLTVEPGRAGAELGALRPRNLRLGVGGLALHLERPFAHQPLHALDRVAVRIEQLADPGEKFHVLRPVVAPAAATLQRPDLRKLALPEAQDVLRNVELLGDLADGAEGRRRFLHATRCAFGMRHGLGRGGGGALSGALRSGHEPTPAPALAIPATPPLPCGASFTRFLSTCDARKTSTRRGRIGTSWPVFGLRPMRSPF